VWGMRDVNRLGIRIGHVIVLVWMESIMMVPGAIHGPVVM